VVKAEVEITLDAVIVSVTGSTPRVLTTKSADGLPALPSGLLKDNDRTIDEALRRWVREQTSLELGYVEQLYTFGDRDRIVETNDDSKRLLSIAYLALVQEEKPSEGAQWLDLYDLFPWEDHRSALFSEKNSTIQTLLQPFITAGDPDEAYIRSERTKIMFSENGNLFDGARSLERYELLYEALLLPESHRGHSHAFSPVDSLNAKSMHLDHRRIAATALGRIRGKLTYRPVVFELLPQQFTLLDLQSVVEALLGQTLHKQNFRRLVETAGLVMGTGQMASTKGRPAELFEFRREVLRERPRPGVG